MSDQRNRLVFTAAAIVLSVSVGLFAASGDAPVPTMHAPLAVPTQNPRAAAPPAPAPALRVDLLSRDAQQAGPTRDVFTAHAWQAPPPPPPPVQVAPPPPPPPPVAPALPFTYLGKLEAPGEKTVIYLVEGEKLHAVSEGDTLNGTHRIESVSGTRMEILYLPLSEKQTLALGNEP